MKQRCYLAGKISGLPDEVWQTNFREAKREVEALGYTPVCPTELRHDHGKTWDAYMRECLTALLTCDAVYAQRN